MSLLHDLRLPSAYSAGTCPALGLRPGCRRKACEQRGRYSNPVVLGLCWGIREKESETFGPRGYASWADVATLVTKLNQIKRMHRQQAQQSESESSVGKFAKMANSADTSGRPALPNWIAARIFFCFFFSGPVDRPPPYERAFK